MAEQHAEVSMVHGHLGRGAREGWRCLQHLAALGGRTNVSRPVQPQLGPPTPQHGAVPATTLLARSIPQGGRAIPPSTFCLE